VLLIAKFEWGNGQDEKWMAVFLGVSLMALLIPAGLRAQAGATGAITGTVSDQKGGAISGATIVVTNVATGHKERDIPTVAGTPGFSGQSDSRPGATA
jgi:hypothetical protein